MYKRQIVGRGWILSGISSKSENFLQAAPRLQPVDLHRLWADVFASGGGSKNVWNQVNRTALFAELSCAVQTEELLFSRDKSVLKLTNRTSSQVCRFHFALTGMMPASFFV